ncbi:Outer membrane protein [Minicystis rosea]|nr:Outer membrane protein [Minicystis rosea]
MYLSALLFGVFLTPTQARADGALTLEDAVRQALTNNERALKAPLRVEVAEGQLDRARTAFLPTLSASATGQLHPADKNSRVVAGTGLVQLNQPLFNLPAYPLYSQAKHQLESERFGAMQDKRLVAFDTARAFLLVLNNQRVLEAAKQRLERARVVEQTADSRAKAALASSNDATLARVDTATASRDVAQAEGALARAYVQLSFLVGKQVSGTLADPDRTMRAAESGAFRSDDVLHLAESRRPDIRSAEERTAALRAAAKEPLYRLAPTLSLSGQVRLTADPIAPDKGHDESAQLTLTWNIYDAGVRYADRRVRLAQADSQALDEKLLRRSIAADVGVSLASLKAAREAYRFSGEAVEAARQNTVETTNLYNQGLVRALELVTANSRRFDAEVNRETARLGVQQAYLDLRFALGLDPAEDEGEKIGASPPPPPPPATPQPTGAMPSQAPTVAKTQPMQAAPNARPEKPVVVSGVKP